MNLLDRGIAKIAPSWALKRAQARYTIKAYEAVQKDRLHPSRRDKGSGDAVMSYAAYDLRIKARDMDRNNDIIHGALNVLEDNIVGTGIRPEPQVRLISGELADGVNEQLTELWKDWIRNPEVTGEWDYYSAQRIKLRTLMRDGEFLQHYLMGTVPFLKHGTRVPFSLEILEPDYLPFILNEFNVKGGGIVQGVKKNAWGKPVAYHLYKQHPGDIMNTNTLSISALKVVSADKIGHIKLVDRLGQTRGVTALSSAMNRMYAIKDIEEYEMVSAKIAASMSAYIKKGSPDLFLAGTGSVQREMGFEPGMIFDNLQPGEEIGTIDTNRPNTNVITFREGMLKAAAGGIGVSNSSMSKNYDGSYSSRRQENVEQFNRYGVVWHYFKEKAERPVWEKFALMAMTAGLVKSPRDVDVNSLDDVTFSRPSLVCIDPAKESRAHKDDLGMGVTSKSEIIRSRGGNPEDVRKQIASEKQKDEAAGIGAGGNNASMVQN